MRGWGKPLHDGRVACTCPPRPVPSPSQLSRKVEAGDSAGLEVSTCIEWPGWRPRSGSVHDARELGSRQDAGRDRVRVLALPRLAPFNVLSCAHSRPRHVQSSPSCIASVPSRIIDGARCALCPALCPSTGVCDGARQGLEARRVPCRPTPAPRGARARACARPGRRRSRARRPRPSAPPPEGRRPVCCRARPVQVRALAQLPFPASCPLLYGRCAAALAWPDAGAPHAMATRSARPPDATAVGRRDPPHLFPHGLKHPIPLALLALFALLALRGPQHPPRHQHLALSIPSACACPCTHRRCDTKDLPAHVRDKVRACTCACVCARECVCVCGVKYGYVCEKGR